MVLNGSYRKVYWTNSGPLISILTNIVLKWIGCLTCYNAKLQGERGWGCLKSIRWV